MLHIYLPSSYNRNERKKVQASKLSAQISLEVPERKQTRTSRLDLPRVTDEKDADNGFRNVSRTYSHNAK